MAGTVLATWNILVSMFTIILWQGTLTTSVFQTRQSAGKNVPTVGRLPSQEMEGRGLNLGSLAAEGMFFTTILDFSLKELLNQQVGTLSLSA